ncbi:hypothetical protein DFH09DRAFT_1353926 [Mycena vulgaris]|nr:hypothetical protein DFH09DRAFT_1353926 [Mycena vulgaris]
MTLVCADSAVSHSTSIAPLCTQRPSRRCRAPLPQYCECAAVAGHIRAGGLAAPSPYAWGPGWCRSLHGARGSAAMWDEPASLRGRPAVGRIATLQRRAFPLHALMSVPAPAAWASARHRLSRLGLVLWRAACALPRPDVCAFVLVDREVSLVQALPTSTSTIHFLHLAFWPASSSETHLLWFFALFMHTPSELISLYPVYRLAMNSDFSSLRSTIERPPTVVPDLLLVRTHCAHIDFAVPRHGADDAECLTVTSASVPSSFLSLIIAADYSLCSSFAALLCYSSRLWGVFLPIFDCTDVHFGTLYTDAASLCFQSYRRRRL